MSIPISKIITIGAQLFSAYEEIKTTVEADGMTPDEFDAAIATERARVDAWVKATDAAEDAEFGPVDMSREEPDRIQ